jgi:hypothetical protein
MSMNLSLLEKRRDLRPTFQEGFNFLKFYLIRTGFLGESV